MPKKILVVDDDPIVVKYLTTLLSDNGYLTCTAADGLEAFTVMTREKPDLITLDLDMGQEWGPKFYRRLIKEPGFKDLPVIVISGMTGQHLAIKKAVASLSKPFDANELLNIVKNVFSTPGTAP